MELLELIALAFQGVLGFLGGTSFWQAITAEWQLIADSRALLLLGVSALCGAMVGLEREHAAKPAGLRTNIMISVGSCLFTLASIYSWQFIAESSPATDPGRIAAQIVTGVGFIGAGVILRTGLHITGITTASTIWLVAAIGMVIGLGFPLLGFLVALGATVTLFLLGGIELHFGNSDSEQ
jgi:putative Mg2+ transporter-C (MgtC) family protein